MLWFLYNFLYVLLYDFLYEAILFTFFLLIFLSFLIVFLSSPFPSPTHLPILPLFLPGQIKMASPLNSQPKDCHSSYQEKPWTATVGEEKKVFYIHPFVLCKASSVFEARITGSWKNATEDTLDWSHFNEETIDCVADYLYSGQYKPRGRYQTPSEPPKKSEPPPSIEARKLENEDPIARLWPCSLGVRAPPAPEKSNETDKSRHDAIDLGERILLHAQVYSFAIEYLVSDLEQYSMDCMEKCLMEEEKVSPQLLPNLLKTIEHIYENTPSSPTMENRAREEICAFVAYNYFILIPDAAANPLSDVNSCFLAELSHKIARIALEKTSTTRALQGSLIENVRVLKSQADSLKSKKDEIAKLKAELKALGPFGSSIRKV